MFKHLFTLIWNKKKQNFLLISEILFSFLVIFGVFSSMVYFYQNYKKPMGIEYENVWVIEYNNSQDFGSTDSLVSFYEMIRQTLKDMPQVKAISYASDNLPFFQNTSTTGFKYNKNHYSGINNYTVEDGYKEVFNVKVLQGRWFEKQDALSKDRPIVINNTMKEKLFGQENPVGKLIGEENDKNKIKIIGVIEDMKAKGDYHEAGMSLYNRSDTGSFRWINKILVRVSPDADAAFESYLYKTMANSMKDANIEIEHLTNKRIMTNKGTLIPMLVLIIVAFFLIVNVALGLFGVLWYNINKRRGEIGLRRAVGATGRSVSMQLVGESLLITTLSLIIGCFFAVQFPLLNVFDLPATVYIIALILATLFIYLLVFVCSLYPGRQAAAIYPAIALHED